MASQSPTGSASTAATEREAWAEAQIASVASSLPLGFAAFALPFFVWGAINADFFDQSARFFLIPIALMYGGLAQVAAGMWAFRKHDGLVATVFGSYGAFWLTYGTLLWMQNANFLALGTAESDLMGLFFISWFVFGAYAWLAAVPRRNYAMVATLLVAAATFIAVSVAYYADSASWMKLGGWLAIVTAALGWYTSAAGAINETVHRMVLPTHWAHFGADIEELEHHPAHLT